MEGAIIKDCREIVSMEVTCNLGMIYYLVCGDYRGGSGNEGKEKGREERKGEERKGRKKKRKVK
jgi:hypothetical protein